MSKDDLIKVFCFDMEIGSLGWDQNRALSYFQYHPEFLASTDYIHLIPKTRIINRVKEVQVFRKFNNETFRGLPPIFADSLPDMFGNIIFKSWLESKNKNFESISVIEQLAYVANRGMGAFEYRPQKKVPSASVVDLQEIVEVLRHVLDLKSTTGSEKLNHKSLLNVFKIGTSAGGARPKILISEHKKSGRIIPGDINYSDDFDHYLIKLCLDDELDYKRELIEYSYYLTLSQCGINMMDSKLVDDLHFATKRFDRVGGEKIHALTVTGITGWDFSNPAVSTYENLFELTLFLKIPHAQIEELFRRMVFNIVFANSDDHLKNHSFVYDKERDAWNLSPAYDVTYSLNPLMNYKKVSRALSINGKRANISLEDVQILARKYTIRNHMSIIDEVNSSITFWRKCAKGLGISSRIISSISKDFQVLK
jgi:serine/threonine-protein kinase HipA